MAVLAFLVLVAAPPKSHRGRGFDITVLVIAGLSGPYVFFLLPLVLTQSPDRRTLPLALWTFQGQYSVNVPAVVASVVLTTLPILVLYAVGRRQLLSGLTAGFSR